MAELSLQCKWAHKVTNQVWQLWTLGTVLGQVTQGWFYTHKLQCYTVMWGWRQLCKDLDVLFVPIQFQSLQVSDKTFFRETLSHFFFFDTRSLEEFWEAKSQSDNPSNFPDRIIPLTKACQRHKFAFLIRWYSTEHRDLSFTLFYCGISAEKHFVRGASEGYELGKESGKKLAAFISRRRRHANST